MNMSFFEAVALIYEGRTNRTFSHHLPSKEQKPLLCILTSEITLHVIYMS